MSKDITSQPINITDSSSLNAISFKYDRTFEKITDTLVPDTIIEDNKSMISSFVSLLSDMSPISVNIVDAFHHQDEASTGHSNHIKGVQDGFNEMYLNDWYNTYNTASNNYVLRNRLNTILEQYKALDESISSSTPSTLDATLSFFNDPDEFFRTERYVLGREFKQKKGTSTAIEYAYKTAWLANIEGPFRTAYDFTLTRSECVGGLSEGFNICTSLTTPCSFPGQNGGVFDSGESGIIYPPQPASTGVGSLIGSFIISDEVGVSECTPFSYSVDAGMLPIMYEAFVVPLAHPVGFKYKYRKLLGEDFTDYFNLEFIYGADKVSVLSLCPDGDCTRAKEVIYSSSIQGVPSVSGSHFNRYEKGDLVSGPWKGYDFEKFIMENGSYLVSYSRVNEGILNREVFYYDIRDLYKNNVLLNSDFDFGLDTWNPSSANWSVVNQQAQLVDGTDVDSISQILILEPNSYYKIQFDVSFLDNSRGNIYIGSTTEPDADAFSFIFDQSISYELDYKSRGPGFDNLVIRGTNTGLSNFSIYNIRITKYMPRDSYSNNEQAAVMVDNPSTPVALLSTSDSLSVETKMEFTLPRGSNFPLAQADYMADLFFNEVDMKATVGVMMIADSRINIPQEETSTGGFIIGGNIIPFGDTETSYMFDDLDHETTYYDSSGDIVNTNWTLTTPVDFVDISGWNILSGWTIDQTSTDNILRKTNNDVAAAASYTTGIPAQNNPTFARVDFRVENSFEEEDITDDMYISVKWGENTVESFVNIREPYDFYTTELTFDEVYILDGDIVEVVYWNDSINSNIQYFQAVETLGDINLSTENLNNKQAWKKLTFTKYQTTGDTQDVNVLIGDIIRYNIESTGPDANGTIGSSYEALFSGTIDINNELFEPVWNQALDINFDTTEGLRTVEDVIIEIDDIVYYNKDNAVSGGVIGMSYRSLTSGSINISVEDFTSSSWSLLPDNPTPNYLIEETVSQEVYLRNGDNIKYTDNFAGGGIPNSIYTVISASGRTEDLSNMIFTEPDFVTNGTSQIVDVVSGDIINYSVNSSGEGSGIINTSYVANSDLGSIDLNDEDFTGDNWTISNVTVFERLLAKYATTGISQVVTIEVGDVIFYEFESTGVSAGGTINEYYRSDRAYSNIDLNDVDFNKTSNWVKVDVTPDIPVPKYSTDNGTRFVRIHKNDTVLHRGETFTRLIGEDQHIIVDPIDINKEQFPCNPTDLVDNGLPISVSNPTINDNWQWTRLEYSNNTYPSHKDARYSISKIYSFMVPLSGNTPYTIEFDASEKFTGSINNVNVTYLKEV